MTRLAASSLAVWDPILRSNRENLLRLLPQYRQDIEALEAGLREAPAAGKPGGVEIAFRDANALRARFSAPRKGFSAPLTEILVDLEDKPGSLLNVLSPLAKAGLNV